MFDDAILRNPSKPRPVESRLNYQVEFIPFPFSPPPPPPFLPLIRLPDEPECGDESRESGGLLPATRIVQEEARERRTPILEHADQRSAREVFRDPVFRDPSEARPVERRLDHEIEFIEQQ